MKIYFAGPLFSEAEKSFNAKLAGQLESVGFSVFLPQRDGVEKSNSPYGEMTDDDRRKAMFEIDRDEIFKSDIFLFVLDGRVPDEGASVELGIAYAQKYLTKTDKILVGLHTDSRAAFIGSKLNPMLKIPLDHIADSEEDLLGFLCQLN
jgi:nucleoside 2-deoxyribosyltransferase